MGRHNKEIRRAYLKRRKEKFREEKLAQEDNTSDIQVDSPATRSHIVTEDKSHSESHILSSSSSSLFPTSSASLPSTRGQICVNTAKSVCTSKDSSTTAAILRGEIPKKVQNDILLTKWNEYRLLNKQLTLIKRRCIVISRSLTEKVESLFQTGILKIHTRNHHRIQFFQKRGVLRTLEHASPLIHQGNFLILETHPSPSRLDRRQHPLLTHTRNTRCQTPTVSHTSHTQSSSP